MSLTERSDVPAYRVRIEAARHGAQTRIFIGDVDVSRWVTGYRITGSVHDATRLTLDLIPMTIDLTGEATIEAQRDAIVTEPRHA